MRLGAGAVWRRLLWTSTFGAGVAIAARRSPTPRYLGEDASQDAFATFIDVLRARLRAERAGPKV